MARAMAGLLTAVVLGGICPLARSQAPALLPLPGSVVVGAAAAAPAPAPSASGTSSQLDAALADLPVGPLPPPAHAPEHIPGPYFEHDPLLDPAELPQPGWITEVGISLLDPHVRYWSNLRGTVQFQNGTTDAVSVPGAHLAWAASPNFALGYRLPAGFGEFAVAYHSFGSDGSMTLPGPDGPSSVRTRLDVNIADFDYRSTEISLWPWMDMKWWAGGEFGNFFFDSRQSTSAALAAAGTGAIDRHVASHYIGFGVHAGGEFACFLQEHEKEWSLVGRIEGADMIGRIQQQYGETSLNTDVNGAPLSGNTAYSSSQEVPTFTFQLGLRWQPSCDTIVFIGGQYEYFWHVGRLSVISTSAEVYDAGFVIQASFTY